DVDRQRAENPSYPLGLEDQALLFWLMNIAGADAAINCWNDKYYWDFWRPWNAIPRAGDDGNPATDPDPPSWAALLTAPYPEHPSGTCASTVRCSARCGCSSVLTAPSSR